MDYTIEDKIYAFCHLKAEERAQEKHLLDAAADLFMRTVPKIDPEAWKHDDDAAAGLRAALPEKYYPAFEACFEDIFGNCDTNVTYADWARIGPALREMSRTSISFS